MSLFQPLDWFIIGAFFVISLAIGLAATRRAGRSSSEFFLSGRSMPWWLLGVSMVATTFAIDTPNLVTGLVRKDGVAGNWVWWAFLLSGMLTVYVFAKLWRRAEVMTDVEFYELRYSGRAAAFLRGFRALYLVNDFYKRFLKPGATEKELVRAGRIATVVTLVLGCAMGLLLTDAAQAFKYLLLLGAGTGAIYILRWFWWRINAVTEIAAMVVSLVVATFFTFWYPALIPTDPSRWWELGGSILPVAITTAAWILAALLVFTWKRVRTEAPR